MIVIKNYQDLKAQLMFFYTFQNNNNHKPLIEIKELVITGDKLEKLIFKIDFEIVE